MYLAGKTWYSSCRGTGQCNTKQSIPVPIISRKFPFKKPQFIYSCPLVQKSCTYFTTWPSSCTMENQHCVYKSHWKLCLLSRERKRTGVEMGNGGTQFCAIKWRREHTTKYYKKAGLLLRSNSTQTVYSTPTTWIHWNRSVHYHFNNPPTLHVTRHADTLAPSSQPGYAGRRVNTTHGFDRYSSTRQILSSYLPYTLKGTYPKEIKARISWQLSYLE